METIFIYLLKSSGLLALFFLADYFLLRKETFFDGNRWFLLSGLITSLLLPIFFIKKVIYIERPKYTMDDLIAFSNQHPVVQNNVSAVEAFDWMQFIWVSYGIIALVLLFKIVFSFVSLYRMLFQQQIIKKENFKLINLNQNIAPFSFFNYIVLNPNLYSNEELQSILLHEKIHSQEKHSIDVLLAKLFCIIFWFNPFVWLYKKAITQNLEYIADQKAMQQLDDKKSYQRALLKVVTHQNCLSITNNFYQSLIKKRIVMLNKNQSQKRNTLKYALIIPALIGFVFLFQIKTIAQEKESIAVYATPIDEIKVKIDKNSSEEKLKQESKRLKDEQGITLKYSKVKRNAKGEITEIKVDYKDKNGNKGTSHIKGNEPIEPFVFFKSDNGLLGFTKPKNRAIISSNGKTILNGNQLHLKGLSNIKFDTITSDDIAFGYALDGDLVLNENKSVVIKGGDNPKVIVNGKVLSSSDMHKTLSELGDEIGFSYSYSSDDEDGESVIINGKPLSEYTNGAINDSKVVIGKWNSEEKEKVKKEIERSRIQIAKNREELAKNREELAKKREEMVKSRVEARESLRNSASAQSERRSELEEIRTEIEQLRKEMAKAKEELAKERAKK
jgi:beta-lactamase regulating signal transducer with metallopeptidase domain